MTKTEKLVTIDIIKDVFIKYGFRDEGLQLAMLRGKFGSESKLPYGKVANNLEKEFKAQRAISKTVRDISNISAYDYANVNAACAIGFDLTRTKDERLYNLGRISGILSTVDDIEADLAKCMCKRYIEDHLKV